MFSTKLKLAVSVLLICILSIYFVGAVAQSAEDETMKAAFIYVGPVGDYGWSHAHDVARKKVDEQFDWLETVYVESVDEAACEATIDQVVRDGADVVFTTSFGFMDPTVKAAEKHPETIFFHCSGVKRAPNLGTYFAELHQTYYLNGLMAGALTESDQLGYVGAFPTPEVKRHINAFAIGAREVNPEAEVQVRWINDWYNPAAAKEATQALISAGVDALAFTEDSPTVLQVAQEEGAIGFSHYSPMYRFAKDATVSGQLVDWAVLYEDILMKIREGIYTSDNLEDVDYWWMLKEGAAEIGAKGDIPINPKYVEKLKEKQVEDPLLGKLSVFELIQKRLEQMKAERVLFDPFIGPLYSRGGRQILQQNEWATHDQLWQMQWAVEGVVGPWPGEPKS